MTETRLSIAERWTLFKGRIRTFGRRAFPFASGAVAALIVLLLYSLVIPKPTPLTQRDVENTIIQAMASATPPPAWSAQVFQVIQPSLVLVETQIGGGAGGNVEFIPDTSDDDGFYFVQSEEGTGAGVIVNTNGDILTSLHVVANAADLRVTFYDGSTSKAQVAGTLPDSDIAVL